MKLDITNEEASWLLRILNQIQIPLSSPDGTKDWTTGRAVRDKLVAGLKEEAKGADREVDSEN